MAVGTSATDFERCCVLMHSTRSLPSWISGMHVRDARPAGLHLALEQAGHQIGAAAIGHVQQVDAGLRGENRHREMVDRAGARPSRSSARRASTWPGR